MCGNMRPIVAAEVRRIESELVQYEALDTLRAIAEQVMTDLMRRHHFLALVPPGATLLRHGGQAAGEGWRLYPVYRRPRDGMA